MEKYLPSYEFAKETGILGHYTKEEIEKMKGESKQLPTPKQFVPEPYDPSNRMVPGLQSFRQDTPQPLQQPSQVVLARDTARETTMIQPGGRILPEVVSGEEYRVGVEEAQTAHPMLNAFVAGALPFTKPEDYQFAVNAAPSIFAHGASEKTIGGGMIPKTNVKIPESEGTNLADLSAGAGEVFQTGVTIALFNALIPTLGTTKGAKALSDISSKFNVPANLASNSTKTALSRFLREALIDVGESSFRAIESISAGRSFSEAAKDFPKQLLIDVGMNFGISAFGLMKSLNYSDELATAAQRKMTEDLLSDSLKMKNMLGQRDALYNKVGSLIKSVDDDAIKKSINASRKYISTQQYKFKRWYKENLAVGIPENATKKEWIPLVDKQLKSSGEDFRTAINLYKEETGVDLYKQIQDNIELRTTLEDTMKNVPLSERTPMDVKAGVNNPLSSKYKQNVGTTVGTPTPMEVAEKAKLPNSPTAEIAEVAEDFYDKPFVEDVVFDGKIIRQVPTERLNNQAFVNIDPTQRTNVLEELTIDKAVKTVVADSQDAVKNFGGKKIPLATSAEKVATIFHKIANYNPKNAIYQLGEKAREIEYNSIGKRRRYGDTLKQSGFDVEEGLAKTVKNRKKSTSLKTYTLNSGESISFRESEIADLYGQFKNKTIQESYRGEIYVVNELSNSKLEVRLDSKDLRKVFKDLPEDLIEEYKAFSKMSGGVWRDVDDTTRLVYGKEIGFQENYYPLKMRGKGNVSDLLNGKDYNLEDAGYLKTRKGDHAVIVVGDFYETVNSYLNFAATYSEVTPYLNDLKRVFDNSNVRDLAAQIYGDSSIIDNYVKQLTKDMQRISLGISPEEGVFFKGINNIAKSNLSANIPVVLKQVMSLPNALTTVSAKNLFDPSNFINAKKTFEKWSELLPEVKIRELGKVSVETSDIIAASKKKFDNGLKLITKMDNYTIGALYGGVEKEVRSRFPDLVVDSREYVAKVRELGLEALKTQPEYIASARSQLLRSKSAAVKGVTMFQTVPNAMFNMVDDAIGVAKSTGDTTLLKKSLIGIAMNGAFISAIDYGKSKVFNTLKNEYFTEDGERQTDTGIEKYTKILIGNYAGVVPLMNHVVSISKGYDVQDITLGKVKQVIGRLESAHGKIEKLMENEDLTEDESKKLSVDLAYASVSAFIEATELLTGAPIKNTLKLAKLGSSTISLLPGDQTADIKLKYSIDKAMGKNYSVSEMYDIVMELAADGKEESAKEMLELMFEQGVDVFSPQSTKAQVERGIPSMKLDVD